MPKTVLRIIMRIKQLFINVTTIRNPLRAESGSFLNDFWHCLTNLGHHCGPEACLCSGNALLSSRNLSQDLPRRLRHLRGSHIICLKDLDSNNSIVNHTPPQLSTSRFASNLFTRKIPSTMLCVGAEQDTVIDLLHLGVSL